MAELVSTLRISGSVNGKKINFTHTYTLEDVYDAGVNDVEFDSAYILANASTVGGTQVAFEQNTPNYLLAVNNDTVGTSILDITLTGGTTYIYLQPKCFTCLTGTQGISTGAASSTDIADESVTSITNTAIPPITGGRFSVLLAFNSTT